MKLEVLRRSLRITCESTPEEAFTEDTLGLKKEGDAVALVRDKYSLRTAPLKERVAHEAAAPALPRVCRWKEKCSWERIIHIDPNLWFPSCNKTIRYDIDFGWFENDSHDFKYCPYCGREIEKKKGEVAQ